MTKSFKILAVVLASLLVLTACTQKAPEPPKEPLVYVSDDGSFRVNKDGAVPYEDAIKAKVTMDDFFDPACGACIEYSSIINGKLKEHLNNGDVEVIYHPLMFLSASQQGNFDKYSVNASTYALAIAESAPTKINKYLDILLSREHLDTLQEVADGKLKQTDLFQGIFEEIGLTEEELAEIEANFAFFSELTIKATDDFVDPSSQWVQFAQVDEAGEPEMYTPFILINKTGERTATAQSLDTIEEVMPNFVSAMKAALGE